MQDTIDLNGDYSIARKRREQDAAQGVTEGRSVTSLKGFYDKLAWSVVMEKMFPVRLLYSGIIESKGIKWNWISDKSKMDFRLKVQL